MRKISLLISALFITASLFAQDKVKVGAYELTPIIDNASTCVKDQHRSSTCWSFCSIGLLENDILKAGKGTYNLSEMWIVRNNYYKRVIKYVRMHGKLHLGGGSSLGDVVTIGGEFGLVPEEAYPGNMYGKVSDGHVHAELDAVLLAFANTIVKNRNKELSTAWKNALNGILDAYFGVRPEKFTYKNVEYTPKSFAQAIGFNADDYVCMASYTQYPYFSYFALEVPDSWSNAPIYNIPFETLQVLMQDVIKDGYSISWAADLDKGFKHSKGLALYPDVDVKNMDNSERDRWEKMTAKEKTSIYDYETVVKEKMVTADEFQTMYDNYDTTDDHGMLMTGLFEDQNGTVFFKTKNSWNVDSDQKGWLYVSAPYARAKTVAVLFNKKALDKKTLKALKLNK